MAKYLGMDDSNLNPKLKELEDMKIVITGDSRLSRRQHNRKGRYREIPYYLTDNLNDLKILIKEIATSDKVYDAGFVLNIVRVSKYIDVMEKKFKQDLRKNLIDVLQENYPPYKDPFFMKFIEPSINVERIACPSGRIGSEIKFWYSDYIIIKNFRQFILENEDKLAALQIICNNPYEESHLTFEHIKQLAEAIEKPPYQLTQESIWQAYEKLERSKVKGAGPQKLLTNIISLVRFATGESEELKPFPETVNERFDDWIEDQELAGHKFTPAQREWLEMSKSYISACLSIGMDDLEHVPFYESGGSLKAFELFGQGLSGIIDQLNKALAR